MAVRPFIPYPDKRLRSICEPVGTIDDAVRAIWNDMLDTMYAMPGVGLAACQIGILQRLAVIDCSDTKDTPIRMANPQVLHASGRFSEYDEGSPNLPGVRAKIKRPRAVTVSFLDEDGNPKEQDFVGLWATSVQHQIDHLDGKMYFDRLSSVKQKMLIAKSSKLAKRKG